MAIEVQTKWETVTFDKGDSWTTDAEGGIDVKDNTGTVIAHIPAGVIHVINLAKTTATIVKG